MMIFLKKYRKEISCLLFAGCLLFSLLQHTYCTAAPATVTMSLEDFQTLENNYKMLQTALDESAAALSEAKQLLTASDADLSELQISLISSKQKITQLQNELAMQRDLSHVLCSELTKLKQESETLEQQLQKAAESLNATEKAYQQEKKAISRKVRFWQVLTAIAAGVAATR